MNLIMAERFAQLRKKAGLSQEELAEKLGISRQAVSKWERAESSPDTDNLIALSKLYGLSLDELLLLNQPEKKEESETEKFHRQAQTFEQQIHDEMNGSPTFSYEQDPFEGEAPAAPQPPYPFEEESGPDPMPQEPIWEDSQPFEEDARKEFIKNIRNQRQEMWQRIHRNFDGAFPLIIICLYLAAGFCFDWWHPTWLLFLTIPIYYAGLYGSYPVLVTLLFLLAGFCFSWWHPAWLLFLTIPLFYLLYHPHSEKKGEPEKEAEEVSP